MKCSKCDTDLTQEDEFCPECGTKVEKEKPQKEEKKHIEKEPHKKGKPNTNYIIIGAVAVIVIVVVVFFISLGGEKCKSPYMEFKKGECCLDANTNNICDNDESLVEEKTTESEVVAEIIGISDKPTGEYKVLTMKNNVIVVPNIFLYEGQESIDKKNEKVFSLTQTEYNDIERVDLRFVPYCRSVDDVGVLNIQIDSRNVFSAVPVCEDAYRQPIPVGVLNVGENRLIFKINKGGYSIEQIKLEFVMKLPSDLFTKLNLHPELMGLENEQPLGGQIDELSLETLKQQFPDVYADAKVGDYLLRYSTRLVIYDYNNDEIVNALNLG